MKTDALIDQLSKLHPKGYDLSLGRITRLLKNLGNPQHKLPPTFHVAGTNGKGSVIANIRAILEAGNRTVHVHTSPHLVNYHERYRIGRRTKDNRALSELVNDDMLADALERVAKANNGEQITVFELLAATTFVLFSEQLADYTVVEVGLGGRFDGTNVIDKPLVSVITPVSLDHQVHLGDTVGKIAFEKAGIIKPGCPVVIGEQENDAREVLEQVATENNCPVMIAGQDFDYYIERGRFIYQDIDGLLDLPLPSLNGAHQLANSATAIAAIRMAGVQLDDEVFETAMGQIHWPGRLERLPRGQLGQQFPEGLEVWIDGGHNMSAGAAIAEELTGLKQKKPGDLVMISAMLNTKNPKAYFANFASLKPRVYTVPIVSSEHGIKAEDLAGYAKEAGLEASASSSLDEAIAMVSETIKPDTRLLISGSLYLVGEVLKQNGTPPV